MKRLSFLFAYLLLLTIGMQAATVEVKKNLWSGTQVMDANWSNWISIAASNFSAAEVGNAISVTVSATSATSAQVYLQNSSWKSWDDAPYKTVSTTGDVTWTITESMLTDLKSSGLIVKGVSYTTTSVDLVTQVETSDVEKVNPITSLWSGSQEIDWTTGKSNCWLKLEASAFTNVKAGNKLRFCYNNLAIGAQGHICTSSWGEMPDGTDYKQLTSSYFEYDVTDDMLTELQSNGCVVNGIGFYLTEVQAIDPTQYPSVVCQLDKANSIKCWEKSEQPAISVSLQSLESKEQDVTVSVALRTDAYEDVKTYTETVTLASGATQTATVNLTDLTTPGFYHAVVSANYQELADFNIGYDPTSIVSEPDSASDFSKFWATAKAELAKVEPNYTLTKIDDKSTSKRNVYLVEMQSITDGDDQPVTIRGYYAEPVAAGTYPVIITQNGYDSDTTIPALNFCPSGDSNPEWIELNLSVRGQIINNRDTLTNKYGDWFAYNFGDKDTYYYRGAYMDVIRGIDFIATREKAQQDNIFMMGGSQGGALTIAGAALDTRVKAIAPSIQFMGDFPDYFKVGSWPASVAKKNQGTMTDEEMYTFLSYFDTKNLATLITCPVTTCMGLQDNVCPPHTNFAPYNNLKVEDKHYVVNPELKHQTASTWNSECLAFFKAHLTNQTEYATVNLNAWNGNLSVDSWSVYQQIAATKFALAATGDTLTLTIPSLNGTSHQVWLQNGKWTQLAGAKQKYVISDVPDTLSLAITDDMLTDLQTNGLIVKGIGYDLTSVDIKHRVAKGDSENKGNAYTNIWTGSEVISWTTGSSNSVFVKAADLTDKLTNAKAGDKLRMTYTGLGFGTAQGKILANWTALSGLATSKFTSGTYFEYTLTDEWLTSIKEKGLRVSGIGYTLTSIDLIAPEKEYNIFAQADDADIKAWEADEKPKIGLTLTNIETVDVSVPCKVIIMKDMVDEDTQTHSIYQTYTQDVTLKAGETKHVDVMFTDLTEPGFYQMIASANNNTVCSYNIGYDPTNIPIKATTPSDFWKYWKEGLDSLAATDMQLQMEELTEKSSDKRKIYLVTMKSVSDSATTAPVTIRGYYAEPVADGKYPTIIHFLGTDGGSSTPWCMDADDNPGYCEFVLSTRGQMLNNREPNIADNVYGRASSGSTDYYSYAWGDKRSHYYRGAYLDCVRAIDFVKTRTKVDTLNLYAVGGSQGGCFTYVAEGLTQAFKAIAPSITGHADFEEGMRIVNWPRAKFLAAKEVLSWTDDQMNEFNSYYDVMNFAEHVTCPVISCFSLQDTTDPTRTNIAPYNLLVNVNKDDKQYIINPFLGHATPSDWSTKYMAFFEKYYSNETTATDMVIGNADDNGFKPVTGTIKDSDLETLKNTDGTAFDLSNVKLGDGVSTIVFNNPNAIIMVAGTVDDNSNATATADWGETKNVVVKSNDGNYFPVKQLEITDQKPVYTDNYISGTVGFKYTRTLAANSCSTVYLPATSSVSLPDGCKAYEMSTVEGNNDAIKLTEVTTLNVFTPYIIFNGNDAETELVVEGTGGGVNFQANQENSNTIGNLIANGTFQYFEGDGSQYGLQNQNGTSLKLKKVSGGIICPFRVYFTVANEDAAAKISFVIDGDETSAINGTSFLDAVKGSVYSLDGRLVKKNATTTGGLVKGIYVINGKKVIVK